MVEVDFHLLITLSSYKFQASSHLNDKKCQVFLLTSYKFYLDVFTYALEVVKDASI